MNIGIIGYGGFGQFLRTAWDSIPEARVTAIADLQTRTSVAAPLQAYVSAEDLLADNDIDVVSIATPPSGHADIACAAMEAGKHVLIEKPLATTLEDAERIMQTRDDTGQIASVDYMLRYHPLLMIIHQLSRSKTFGSLNRAAIENFAQDEQLPANHWFWDRTISGGILVEHGTHFLDLVNWLNGSGRASISSSSVSRNSGQTDRVLAMVDYESGLSATHYHDFSRPGLFERTFVDLAYDLANIHLEGWIPLTGTIRALTDPARIELLHLLPGLEIVTDVPIDQVPDDSRPHGWGPPLEAQDATDHRIFVRGVPYSVDHYIEGKFSLGRSKAEVYLESVAALQSDLIAAIGDSGHRMGVSLEDGWVSLELALKADESGLSRTR